VEDEEAEEAERERETETEIGQEWRGKAVERFWYI
jgi:hypothetical protein